MSAILSLSFCPHNPCLFRPGVWLVEILIKGKIFKDAAAVAVVVAVATAPAVRRMNIKMRRKKKAKRTQVEWSHRGRGVAK